MGLTSHFLVFLLSSLLVLVSTYDDESCRPGYVRNLKLNGTSHLTWDPPLNENCDIIHYLVFVTILGSNEEWTYTVTETILDVGHLTSCLRYYFRVSQVSVDNVTGPFTATNVLTPPPSDANLALQSVRLIPQGTDVKLEWSLQEEFLQCVRWYRTVIYNEETDLSFDIHTTSPSVTITSLTPCGSYTFTVRALFTLVESGPATLLRHVVPRTPTANPTLKGITLGNRSAYLTLGLQSWEENMCTLNSVIVNANPYFNSTFHIQNQETRDTFVARLTGLDADSLYFLRIYANNTAGNSDALLLAVQTLTDD